MADLLDKVQELSKIVNTADMYDLRMEIASLDRDIRIRERELRQVDEMDKTRYNAAVKLYDEVVGKYTQRKIKEE
jgi:hypothetical protein